jgi:hypothetical protein
MRWLSCLLSLINNDGKLKIKSSGREHYDTHESLYKKASPHIVHRLVH